MTTSSRKVPGSTMLSRRTVLRAAAAGSMVGVGLPLLEIMLNSNGTALADGEPLASPFVLWFMGNGFRLNQFEPAKTGPGFELTPELAPLASVKDYVSVCTGYQNWCLYQTTHHEGMTVFNGYTFADWTGQLFSKAGGPTVDQVIADKIGAKSRVKSVQIGISKRLSMMDNGTTMHSLSHRGTNEALFPQFNPQEIWRTLFRDYVPRPDDRALRQSVLDSIKDDAARLRTRLGTIDRSRLDAHLEGVAELERKIAMLPPPCMAPDMPSETNADVAGKEPIVRVNEVMSDLLVHALKCDISRVFSVLFVGGAAETTFSDLGQTVGHHQNTHDEAGDQPEVNAGIEYSMKRFAYLLEKMKAEVDVTGLNLLDTSVVYMSSDCSEGRTHSVSRQPVILVGHGRNKLVYPGVHVQATPLLGTEYKLAAAKNTSDILYTAVKAYDPSATSVGEMTPRARPNVTAFWYGTSNPPDSIVTGSDTLVPELLGSKFSG